MNFDLDIPLDRPVALFLRHAERPPLGSHDVGLQTALTAAGALRAQELGRALTPVLKDIVADRRSLSRTCRAVTTDWR